MGLFSGCQFALELSTRVPFKRKADLRKKITSNDGVVSYIVTKQCTHVVVSDADKADISYKCKAAQKYGIPLVSMDYIYDSVDSNKVKDTDNYLILGKTKAQEFSVGKVTAAKNKVQEKKLKKPTTLSSNMLNKLDVWQFEDASCPKFDEKSYEIARSVVLKEDLGERECRFSNDTDEVIAIYGALYQKQTDPPNNFVKTSKSISWRIGSDKFRQIQDVQQSDSCNISDGVKDLLEHIWQEATGEVEALLSVRLDRIKVEQIEKAEAALLEIKQALDAKKGDLDIERISNEFYAQLPHNKQHKQRISNKRLVAKKYDLCQLVKDMIAVSESSNWSVRSTVESKYRAVRCHIQHLSHDSQEHDHIAQIVASSQVGSSDITVKNIYSIHRSVETANFRTDLPHRRKLFHASGVENFVGILSRGLLLPKTVVDDFGVERSDIGMLGSGIYFTQSSSTSAKYSKPSGTKGTRLMAFAEVALGNCKDVHHYDYTLKAPPPGFDSVHGVRKSELQPSQFEDDEYVIYNTNQQHLTHLIEFSLSDDTVNVLKPLSLSSDPEEEKDVNVLFSEVSLDDIKELVDPLSKVQPGLVSTSDIPVPLKSVHVRAKVIDLASQVVVLQAYTNHSNVPIEAKYVFPLDELAVVCGFEAFINGKHVIGEVKEKEEAHIAYKKAIIEGHGAYLMDQDEETPDVFTVSVGNLPPHASVLIKITYVAELLVDGDAIVFSVPGSVAPWKKKSALDDVTQSDLDTIKVNDEQNEVTIHVAIEMPFDIKKISSPSHKIRLKKTATKAVVEMLKNQALDGGFQLFVSLAEIHVPRMWVEQDPDNVDHQACMLTFYPEFEAQAMEGFEVIFLLDLSNSMKGKSLVEAQKVLLLTLHHLPSHCNFNIVTFGTGFDELFPTSRSKTKNNINLAHKFVMTREAVMGNTEIYHPLHAYFLLCPRMHWGRNVFLLSDGHINNEAATLAVVKSNSAHTRLFTFGVSSTANRHILRALAKVGAGDFEFFDSKTKSKWERKVQSQLMKSGQPGLSEISVEWQKFDEHLPDPVQAPKQITSIFNGCRQVVYGFVPNCLQATLRASIDDQQVSTMVSTSDLSVTQGKILHRLTAHNVIKDWQNGSLAEDIAEHQLVKKSRKKYIINLSIQYSIVTPFTSFVAIETRDKDEMTVNKFSGPSIEELVQRESVDILTVIGWDVTCRSGDASEQTPEVKVQSLLNQAKTEEMTMVTMAQRTYTEAWELSQKELPPSHHLRLSVALALMSFYTDTVCDEEKAVKLGKTAFDDCVSELDSMYEDSYAGSTLLMQNLRDRLTSLTSKASPVEEPIDPQMTTSYNIMNQMEICDAISAPVMSDNMEEMEQIEEEYLGLIEYGSCEMEKRASSIVINTPKKKKKRKTKAITSDESSDKEEVYIVVDDADCFFSAQSPFDYSEDKEGEPEMAFDDYDEEIVGDPSSSEFAEFLCADTCESDALIKRDRNVSSLQRKFFCFEATPVPQSVPIVGGSAPQSGSFGGPPVPQSVPIVGGSAPQSGSFGGPPVPQSVPIVGGSAPQSGSFGGPPVPQSVPIVGGSAPQSGSFGGPPVPQSGLFGACPAPLSDLFSRRAPQSGSFGAPPAPLSDLFCARRAPQSGLSGPPPAHQSGSFGPPPAHQSGSFGAPAAPQSGLFEARPAPLSGLFGSRPAPQSGSFGAPPAPQSGSFGAPPAPQAGSFGAPPAPQSGSFGAPPATQSGSFGAPPATQSGPFRGYGSTPLDGKSDFSNFSSNKPSFHAIPPACGGFSGAAQMHASAAHQPDMIRTSVFSNFSHGPAPGFLFSPRPDCPLPPPPPPPPECAPPPPPPPPPPDVSGSPVTGPVAFPNHQQQQQPQQQPQQQQQQQSRIAHVVFQQRRRSTSRSRSPPPAEKRRELQYMYNANSNLMLTGERKKSMDRPRGAMPGISVEPVGGLSPQSKSLDREKVRGRGARGRGPSLPCSAPPRQGSRPQGLVEDSGDLTQDLLLLDVTPLGLGVETADGIMHIIHRNTTIPTRKTRTFTTRYDYQSDVLIKVYEGIKKTAKYNKILDQFQLPGIYPAPRGSVVIEVTFEIDAQGHLKVTAVDSCSLCSRSIIITNELRCSQTEITTMLRTTDEDCSAHQNQVELSQSLLIPCEKSLPGAELPMLDPVSKPLNSGSMTQPASASSRIVTGPTNWTANDIQRITSLQESDGHWEVSKELESLLAINWQICDNTLLDAGLKSLGTVTTQRVRHVTLAMIALLRIILHLGHQVSSLSALFSAVRQQKDNFDLVIMALLPGIDHALAQVAGRGLSFISRFDAQTPSVCTALQLGKSWPEAVCELMGYSHQH